MNIALARDGIWKIALQMEMCVGKHFTHWHKIRPYKTMPYVHAQYSRAHATEKKKHNNSAALDDDQPLKRANK